MAYGVYSDRGYREHILERNKNTNKTEVFTQEDQTFTGRKTFLSGVTTSDLEVRTVEVSESLKVKGKDIREIIDYLPAEIENKHKYSTEETVIDKWIDGKNIYRKVLNINPVNIRDWTIIPEVDNLNIKKIIKTVIMGVEVPNQDCVIFPNVRRNSNGKFEFLSFSWGITATTIILEYTKTTD